MKVENIVLKDGQKEVVINGLKAEIYKLPRTKNDKPSESVEIDSEKEIMIWTVYGCSADTSVSSIYPWELEDGEVNDIKEAVFQIYELI